MTRPLLYCIVLIIVIPGCGTIKHPKREGLVNLQQDPAKINGQYKNMAVNAGHSLWSVLNRKRILSAPFDTTFNVPFSSVRFTAQNKKTILAELYIDSSLVQQKKIKGRMKGSYFLGRVKLRYFGLPFTYLTYAEYKISFCKDSSGRLFMDAERGWLVWVFIFSGGNWEQYVSEYN